MYIFVVCTILNAGCTSPSPKVWNPETWNLGTFKTCKKNTFSVGCKKKSYSMNQQNFMHPRTLTNRYAKSSPKLEARRYIICGKSVLFSFPGCVNRKKIRWRFLDVFFFCMAWIGAILVPGSRSSSAVLSWSHWKKYEKKWGLRILDNFLSSHFEYKMEMITKASWKT